MTTRPRLVTDVNYRNGAAAVALFAVMAWTFVTAQFPAPLGFGEGSITATIGYAMFDLLEQVPDGHGETEGFLVAFLVVAVVLDAALDGAVMLARREEDDSVVTALADGGRRALGAGAADESGSDPGDAGTGAAGPDAGDTGADGGES